MVFKQGAFLLNHGLLSTTCWVLSTTWLSGRCSYGHMNQCLLMQYKSRDRNGQGQMMLLPLQKSGNPLELQALCQSSGVYHKYFIDAQQGLQRNHIFWIYTFNNKNADTLQSLPIQLEQGTASEGGIDLGSKGCREVNRCGRWIVNTTSHFDIWPFPQFILVNAYV